MVQDTSERLLQTMSHLNLSGYRVQKKFGLSGGVVSNWRKGICQPRMSTIDMFCKEYGISKSWILTGNGDMMDKHEPDPREVFLKSIEKIKAYTGKSNKELSKIIGSYSTVISEVKSGKANVQPEWMEILERKFGFIYNEVNMRKEIVNLREELGKIKALLKEHGIE